MSKILSNTKYQIPYLSHYTSEMAKAIEEKLWFLKHIWVTDMIEIGAGDGVIPITMYKEFKHAFEAYVYEPNKHLHWDLEQNVKALDRVNNKSIWSTDNYLTFKDRLRQLHSINVLVLSSVLHEVFDDGLDEVAKMFNLLSEMYRKPEYIAIRDMKLANETIYDCQTVEDRLHNHRSDMYDYLLTSYPRNFKRDMLYLMKHRYTLNWEHEKDEDYFSVNWRTVDLILKTFGYELEYEEEYLPKFFQEDFKSSFGLELEGTTTHVKLLYKYKG